MKPRLYALVALALLPPAPFVVAQSTQAAATPPSATQPAPPAPPDWPRILSRLASPSFPERQSAEADLVKIPPELLNDLESRAYGSSDPEVQARLLQRANDIRAYLAVHPTPFSLSVKAATLDEVVAQINRQAGATLFAAKVVPNDNPRFTLTADRLSFADLYLALYRQHPLILNTGTQPYTFQTRASSRDFFPADGFLVSGSVAQANEVRNNAAAPVPSFQLRVALVPDPRVRIARAAYNLRITEARDNRGTDLTGGLVENSVSPGMRDLNPVLPTATPSASFRLATPNPAATRILRVRGFFRIQVAVESHHIAIDDIEAQVNKPIPLPRGNLLISAINRNNGSRIVARWSEQLPRANTPPGDPHLLTYTLTDSAGQPMGAFSQDGSGGSGMWSGNPAPGPMRLDIHIPTRLQDVSIPFELLNLPLPQRRP